MTRFLELLAALAWLAGCSPALDWREVRSEAGGFVVSLPGKAQVVTREVELPLAGASYKVSMTMTSAGAGATLFAVGFAPLPAALLRDPASTQATLAWFRDGLLRNIEAAGVATAPAPALVAKGGPVAARASEGFDARGRTGRPGQPASPARLAVRLYVVDDRLYQIVAMGAVGDLPDTAVETFFTSFRLVSP
jgi:hypothetical protein